jgi:hypothetical protein
MDGACSMLEGRNDSYTFSGGKPGGKRQVNIWSSRTWVGCALNVEMTSFVVSWRALEHTPVNLPAAQNAGKFLIT